MDYAPAIATETIAVLAETRAVEGRTTGDVIAAIPAGARPHGLEFRMKSPKSLARKLRQRATRSGAESDAAGLQATSGKLTDLLRYTAVTERHDDLPSTVETTISGLQQRGYTVVSAEHSYVGGNTYKGIHVLVQHGDERPVEVQFHSELSQGVKDENHVDYEVERDRRTKPYEERFAAYKRMTSRSSSIPRPAGLDGLVEIGGLPLVEKIYPNPYSVAHNENEETSR